MIEVVPVSRRTTLTGGLTARPEVNLATRTALSTVAVPGSDSRAFLEGSGDSVTVTVGGTDRPLVAMAPAKRIDIGLARQGPRGTSGDNGAGEFEAGEAIGGHRLVYFDASGLLRVASSSEPNAAVGLVRDAVSSGQNARVYKDGAVNGFTGLQPGARYWLSSIGTVTATPPATGIVQPLGTAATDTILIVEIGEPVYL